MRPTGPPSEPPPTGERPHWNAVIRALREVRGATQDGWAARLGVSRKTVQRWESGERAPDPGAETALIAACRELGLFRSYDRGPLAGLDFTPDLLKDLLTEARWRMSDRPSVGVPVSDVAPALQADEAPRATPRAMPLLSNLPVQLTSFVGREEEIGAVRRLQATTRLLTLTGAGGCGKTRLALRVADELLWAYPHGVWVAELAALADPALVPGTAAAALSLQTTGLRPPVEELKDFLRARDLLLILDNCEHVLSECAPLVEALLRACPALAVLATSREPLGVAGETIWRVPPLAVPSSEFRVPRSGQTNSEPGTRNSELEQPDAVRLFVERARLHRPEFELTEQNAAAVGEICRRLDGMPLAIELAAARVNVLSPEGIAARLGDRFRLLTGGGRTALPRHQTLRAAMDWSHDLLTAPERATLRRLSVFAGGFTLEAAEAVSSDVFDGLTQLVDKSLVIAEARGEAVRYRMLESVRQYATEQLDAAGEGHAVRVCHVEWCLALAEAAAQRNGTAQDTWLERLTVEHENIRAALSWCLADDDGVVTGLRIAGALWWFWQARGHYSEGRRWLGALLERGGDMPPAVRATALNGAGALAVVQSDYDEAARLLEHGLALWSELGDEAGAAVSLNSLAIVADMRGDPTRARALFEENLALERKLGDRQRIAISLSNLGILARRQGELERAVALYDESLIMQRELSNTFGVATVLQNLGNALRDQGRPEQAAASYREGVSLFGGVQHRLGAARCLEGLAGIAVERGDAGRAALLGGAAAGLRAAIAVPLPPAARADADRTREAACTALGEDAFAAAWTAGQTLSLDEAVAAALDDAAADGALT